jgi:D-erythronate 2-dehydrogenase
MPGARVLLTGAFGSVGGHALAHCVRLGHAVTAVDVDTRANRRTAQKLAARHDFQTAWVDLREGEAVARAVASSRPEVVLHVAAVIAPHAFVHPELAEAVNVGGTRSLIQAATRLQNPPRFVLTSSYNVHGPRNPYRNLPPLTGDTPLAPADSYGRHKAMAEALLEASGLPWTTLRLPAVLATDPKWGSDAVFLKFFYMLSPDRREHLLDARDAGLALAHAVEANGVVGRAWNLGGPEQDCRVIGIDFHHKGMSARGLMGMRPGAFRLSHPDVDESWFAEDWVDTAPSQAVLSYQQHSFADHLELQRFEAGRAYWLMRGLARVIRYKLESGSPYLRRPHEPDPTPHDEVVRQTFQMTPPPA